MKLQNLVWLPPAPQSLMEKREQHPLWVLLPAVLFKIVPNYTFSLTYVVIASAFVASAFTILKATFLPIDKMALEDSQVGTDFKLG